MQRVWGTRRWWVTTAFMDNEEEGRSSGRYVSDRDKITLVPTDGRLHGRTVAIDLLAIVSVLEVPYYTDLRTVGADQFDRFSYIILQGSSRVYLVKTSFGDVMKLIEQAEQSAGSDVAEVVNDNKGQW